MSAIFTGTTAECLAHLARSTKADRFNKRKILASFAGVGDETVFRWFKEVSLPVGEPLLRLRFYMEFLGYNVEEIQKLPPYIRDAARLFAFRVVSLSEMAQLLGYPEGRSSTDTLLGVFRGVRRVTKLRQEEFMSFVKAYGEQLSEKERVTPKILLNDDANNAQAVPVPEAIKPLQVAHLLRPSKQQPHERDVIIESLAGSVKALIPLARAVSSDSFSAEERALVRELAGGDGVFILANLLYRLCGERARKMHSSN